MSVTAEFRKQVVADIEATGLTSREAGAKYNIKQGTVRQWLRRSRGSEERAPRKEGGVPAARPVSREPWDTHHKQRAPMDGLPEETRAQVVDIVRRTYDLIDKALTGEHQRLDDKSGLGPNVTPRLDQKVAGAVRAWVGTIALMIDTHPGVLSLVKAGATDSASQTAERARRVAEALLGDLPPEEP